MAGINKLMLMVSFVFLSGCYNPNYAIYLSSEGSGEAMAVNKKTGIYFALNGAQFKGYDVSYAMDPTIQKKRGFLYFVDFWLAIPDDRNAVKWEDEGISCAVSPQTIERSTKQITCSNTRSLNKIPRISTYELDAKRGIISFQTGCNLSLNQCTYRLRSGNGIFASNSSLTATQ